MRRTVIDCDSCGKKDTHCERSLLVHTGYAFGGPGGGEEEHDSLDLCQECLLRLADGLIGEMPMDARVALVAKWRKKR